VAVGIKFSSRIRIRQFPDTNLLFLFDTVGFCEKYCSRFHTIRISIQDDSKGKVNILGGDSIGHCEKKSSYGHVSNSEWLPR
jgi:hypothetical protein